MTSTGGGGEPECTKVRRHPLGFTRRDQTAACSFARLPAT